MSVSNGNRIIVTEDRLILQNSQENKEENEIKKLMHEERLTIGTLIKANYF